ncbi:MAG: S1 RNA-binding domain-containing protein [Nanoarchaeota archaeon]|nr:S1 RNA-binding domain-containing protein [Nanoarchaeota archaeon]
MSSINDIQENDTVLCTVKKIEGTGIFVKLDEYDCEGTITLSEISPGRIRNIREFVSVGKKIVCKIMRKKDNSLELSLRRVSAKERDLILEHYKRERILASILKSATGEKSNELMTEIKKERDTSETLEEMRTNPGILKKYLTPAQLIKLKEILSQKKESIKEVQKKITIRSDDENGIIKIREILETKEANVSYLGSSNFLIRVKSNEYKQANNQLEKVIASIKEKAKKAHAHLEVK